MFEKLKNLFKKQEVEPVAKKEPKPKQQKPPTPELTEKEKATAAGEPYVNIIHMEVDPKDLNSGSVTLDWNEKFLVNLIRAGYKMKETDTDNDIVDRYWVNLCRATVLETFEQEIADPDKRAPGDVRNVVTRDLGNGRTEVS